jgi:RecB family exonuclease
VSPRLAGLAHLERNLFRPVRQIQPASDASGLLCLEAPGLVGEARLVARRIKALLRDGVPAGEILVSVRDLTPYADLLHEVFDEYGIPVDVEGTDALQRDPAVGLLLRALRMPEDDWPFSPVTALLRSNFFRPRWPEARHVADVPLLAEALLRLLAEPRGREAYLEAARRWALREQPGLEDEQAQESRRRRTHNLARQCGPFLERFFRSWDDMPTTAPLGEHVRWLRVFAEDLGLADDTRGWRCFWDEIARWQERDEHTRRPRALDRRTFQRRLQALAGSVGVARTVRGPGRVRVLSAELACDLDADHVFILGLGEGSFPSLASPSALLDEAQRQALRAEGLELTSLADRLPAEMLLFYRLATRARRQLVLSYPAIDERGQPLLPSSFLSAALDLFAPKVIPVERKAMLIEGFDREEPLSPAEQRIQLALQLSFKSQIPNPKFKKETTSLFSDLRFGILDLDSPVLANLRDAAEMARKRFRERGFSPFEGQFRDPRVIAEVARMFGPERVFSPTALEDFVACPFRFFLGHVLHLEPLEDPREEIEVTRRGQAFHRALSRLHRQLKDAGIHQPADGLDEQVRQRLSEAIAEDVARAPGPASKRLWELEGQRMLRVSRRYPEQWQQLVAPWLEHDVRPRPFFFEVDFGLPAEDGAGAPYGPLVIRGGDIEVRVSGRIDRVDVAEARGETYFWIIDYKTGRGEHYTSRALVEFQRLQLTLYALAVEEVLLADRRARPLGLAYWLLTEQGPKVVLPVRNQVLWLSESRTWRQVRRTLEEWIVALVQHIRAGNYPLRPRSENCTQTCDFGQICRITQSRTVPKDWSLELPVVSKDV